MDDNDDDRPEEQMSAPSTPGVQKAIQEVSSVQSHLTTSNAASLASASSVPPPLLSRSSIKSLATQSQDATSTPSLLVHLGESTQGIHLSPSPSRPRSIVSIATDEGLGESMHSELGVGGQKNNILRAETTSTGDDSAIRTQFLAKRLRSAIGEDLVLRKQVEAQVAAGQPDVVIDRKIAEASASRAPSTSDVLNNLSPPSDDSGWSWSTFTTLSSSLRMGAALNSLKIAPSSNDDVKLASTIRKAGPSMETNTSTSAKTDQSFGSYIKPLDVRKWWTSSPSSSRSESSERPKSNSRANSIRIIADDKSLKSNDSPKKGLKKPEAAHHPIKGFPAGSFPSPSIAKRNKKKENLLKRAKGKEREGEGIKDELGNGIVNGTASKDLEGFDIVEHDLSNHIFGLPDAKKVVYPEREYVVLSTAGKPIFVSHVSAARLKRAAQTRARRQNGKNKESQDATEEQEDALAAEDQAMQDDEDQKAATRAGLFQALISNYQELGIKELQKRSTKILELPRGSRLCFLLKPPLYLVAISQWGEDEVTLRNHLEYLHYAIISLVSASKLKRLFDRAANFDLKRLLEGTDGILDNLLKNLQVEATPLYDSLQPLRIDATLRSDLGAALIPSKDKIRPQDALYALLLTKSGIVTLAKRKRKSIHPVDCHLLINTVYATKAMKEAGTQSWVPICLPKFAPQGYLYAHVSFLEEQGEDATKTLQEDEEGPLQNKPTESALVLVTSNPDGFEELNLWQSTILENLKKQKLLGKLLRAVESNRATYNADEMRLPGLRHFIFKWRSNLQSTSPQFEDPYIVNGENQKRLICLYGIAQDYIYRRALSDDHIEEKVEVDIDTIISTSDDDDQQDLPGDDKSSRNVIVQSNDTTTTTTIMSPPSPIIRPRSVLADSKSSTNKSAFSPSSASSLAPKKKPVITGQHMIKTTSEIVYAWSTPLFELYLAAGPHLPRNAIINIAKSIVKWVKQEEQRLFIAGPSLFD